MYCRWGKVTRSLILAGQLRLENGWSATLDRTRVRLDQQHPLWQKAQIPGGITDKEVAIGRKHLPRVPVPDKCG